MLPRSGCYGKTRKAEVLGNVSTLVLLGAVKFLTVELLKLTFLLKVILRLLGSTVKPPRWLRTLINYRCIKWTLCRLMEWSMQLTPRRPTLSFPSLGGP